MLGKVTPELSALLANTDRVTLLSGPSGAGKSTLMRAIRTDPDVQASFGLTDRPSWIVDPGLWEGLYDSRTRSMFLTYNHNRVWIRNSGEYSDDEILHAVRQSNDLVVVTMWDEPESLLRRANTRIRSTRGKIVSFKYRTMKPLYRLRVQLKLRSLYQNPDQVWRQYRRWLTFCDEHGVSKHWSLRGKDSSEMTPMTDNGRPFWE